MFWLYYELLEMEFRNNSYGIPGIEIADTAAVLAIEEWVLEDCVWGLSIS